ncbi:hypothetical protein BDZ45DRAFT_635456, partial [Acephala macrosclerotiorum]
MVEIEPEQEPATPMLASTLLELEEKQRTRFTRHGRPERLSSGCEEVDEILGGGVERGIVMGISAEGTEGRMISLHLLTSILLSHLSAHASHSPQKSNTKATIIDTTGSFPLPLLAQILKSRITTSHALQSRNAIQTANHAVSRPDQTFEDPLVTERIERDVQRCLEMVDISRVFDIEGLWEVLGEVGRNDTAPLTDLSEEGEETTKTDDRSPVWPAPEPEINDSQEDLASIEEYPARVSNVSVAEVIDSDEEDLSPIDEKAPKVPKQKEKEEEDDGDGGVEIVIIDNMTRILNDLFSRREKNDALNLATLLSHQIHTLSHTLNHLTILHNSTTLSRTPSSSTYPQNPLKQPSLKSIFASNPLKPSLGSLFSQFPSLHVLCSSLPKTREDAELLFVRDDQDGPLEPGKVGYCCVVEVLKDEAPNLGGLSRAKSGGNDEKGKGEEKG